MNWSHKNPPRRSNDESTEEIQKIISFGKPNDDSSDGNRIYFYQDVTRDSMLALNKQIDEATKQAKIIQLSYNLAEPPPVEIHICSDGGEVYGAMASVDKIINNPVPIHTYCEGIVASAATLISVVGAKRFISKNSCMLIHQVTSGLWGNYMEFQDEIKNLDLIMKLIRNVYLKHTNYKPDELDAILKHDLCLSAEECLKMGLVDKIQ